MKKTCTAAVLLTMLAGCQPDVQHAESIPAAGSSAVTVTDKSVAKADVVVLPDAETKLAQKSGCFACHSIDRKLVGPSWKEVAAKYRGQKDAEARLVAKVAKGGSGVWGSSPMPPNAPRVGNDDIRTLVRFILSLK